MKEVLLRVGGTAVGLLLGFVTGVWEVFLSPLYAGRIPLPVAPVLAVATNLGLVWFTHVITGRKGLALLPGIPWFAVMLVSANKTAEGDVPIPGNDWMGLLAVLLGALAWGIAAYRLILPGVARPDVTPASRPVAAPGEQRAPRPAGAGRAPRPGARPTRSGARRPGGGPGGGRGRGGGA